MEREDTKDSSTFYDSNDDDDLDDEEDDDVETIGNDSTHSQENSKSTTLAPSQSLPRKTTKSEKNKKKGAKKRKGRVIANLAGTKFSILKKVCKELGMKVTEGDSPDCMLTWNDAAVTIDRIVDLKLFQGIVAVQVAYVFLLHPVKINHFPGMGEISRKDTLARNMSKIQKECPEEFNFVPQTWNFPGEYTAFQSYLRDLKKKKKHRTFIIKPASGAMGNGIRLTRSADKLLPHTQDNIIVQEYIEKPLLMDNFKFDLRIYVLVTSCDPLKLFIYNDGLVRMSTVEYSAPSDANISCQYMHLTNYSVNKYNDAFVKTSEAEQGSKRTLKYLFEWLKSQDKNPDIVWANIQDVVVKTLLVAQPHVYRAYHVCRPSDPAGCESVCFEVLGFDILLDRKLKAWVLEVNRAPSFGTDQALDYTIKKGMLRDAFKLVNIRLSDKRKGIAQEKREARKRLLKPVKRSDEVFTQDKRKQALEQKRSELKVRLAELRRDSAKEEYENKHMGNFKRIYPSDDKVKAARYKRLSEAAAKAFTGRPYLQRDAARHFQALKEHEVLELLEQVEDGDDDALLDVSEGVAMKPPKPLSSLPSAKPPPRSESPLEIQRRVRPKRPYSSTNDRIRSSMIHGHDKRRGLSKSMSSLALETQFPRQEDQLIPNCLYDNIDELTRESLTALNAMKIKFPGKSDEQACDLLDTILENWKYHKPKVASYWLVKLDSLKRRKVIDIVKGNVRAILQRIWKAPDIDSLRLCRMFNKIFNRLTSNHGQGLWNCFSSNGDSWESIITKTTENLTTTEMNCCRRVVQLCRECLLVVYEFASQTEAAQSNPPQSIAVRSASEAFKSHQPYQISSRYLASHQNPGQKYGRTFQNLDYR